MLVGNQLLSSSSSLFTQRREPKFLLTMESATRNKKQVFFFLIITHLRFNWTGWVHAPNISFGVRAVYQTSREKQEAPVTSQCPMTHPFLSGHDLFDLSNQCAVLGFLIQRFQPPLSPFFGSFWKGFSQAILEYDTLNIYQVNEIIKAYFLSPRLDSIFQNF